MVSFLIQILRLMAFRPQIDCFPFSQATQPGQLINNCVMEA